MIPRGAWPAALIGASALLTVLVYAPTVGYGFYYDDYHFVRPYAGREILHAFHGPWDPAAIETAYYRPLTICLYAARFALLGVNAHAYHLTSLALFALAAALFAVFTTRASGSRVAGALGAAAFIVHPGMPYAAVAWVTNQMHLAELIVVLTAFLWWFHVRARPSAWWLPLLAFQAAAFLIKEDGIMLIPAVVVLHVLRKSLVERELPHVPPGFLVAAAVVIGGLLGIRGLALQGSASHRLPSLDQAWTNWTRGLGGAFRLLPAKRPWQAAASGFVTVVPILALLAWRRISRGARFTLLAGAAVGVLFVLPFAFIIKGEQMHLVNAGAALLLAASLAGLLDAVAAWRIVAIAVLGAALAGLAAMALVARDIMRDFEPYGPIVLHTDRMVEGWAAVPLEWREYLTAKRTAAPPDRPDPDPSRGVPLVAFGLHGREHNADGMALRWMAGPVADVFVRRGTRLLSFQARHERGAFGEPAHLRIDADGAAVVDTVIDDDRWHRFDIALKQRAWIGAGGTHRLRIAIDHAWIPAAIIAGSNDTRTLGLQIGEFDVR